MICMRFTIATAFVGDGSIHIKNDQIFDKNEDSRMMHPSVLLNNKAPSMLFSVLNLLFFGS